MILDRGEIDSNTEYDKNVARAIVRNFKDFKDIASIEFIKSVDKTKDIDENLKQVTSYKIDPNHSGLHDSPFNTKNLTAAYKSYNDHYMELFRKNLEFGPEKIIQHTLRLAQDLKGKVTVKDWSHNVRTWIPKILAGVYSVFSIIKCGESYLKMKSGEQGSKKGIHPMDIVLRPHNIQVTAIFILLGLAYEDRESTNHVMEVRTGEGKSIILGGLSIVLAILGFSVRTVCYSPYLSERDRELFQEVFEAFRVEDSIGAAHQEHATHKIRRFLCYPLTL